MNANTDHDEAPCADPLARLGAPHGDSYSADWCVAVWPHADGWIVDSERGDGSVEIVTRDDDGNVETIWSGNVENLPAKVL